MASSGPEEFVLTRNVMFNAEMIWALGVLVGSVSWWRAGRIRGQDNTEYLKLLKEFDRMFSRAVDRSSPVRDVSVEPEACGLYQVWGEEDADMSKWPRRPHLAFWVRGKGFNDPHVSFWQELPEGLDLEGDLKSCLEKIPQTRYFWNWLGLYPKLAERKNLAVSVRLTDEMVKAVRLIEGYALRQVIGRGVPDAGASRQIGFLLDQFKANLRRAVQNAAPVVRCKLCNPEVPGRYLVWRKSRSSRFIAEWRNPDGWTSKCVFWMQLQGFPIQRENLARYVAACPLVDFRSEIETVCPDVTEPQAVDETEFDVSEFERYECY